MLTLIVMVMMENDCHDYQPLPMSTLLLMEIRASLVHHHVDVDITRFMAIDLGLSHID